jgi:hypothetical protein
VLTQASTQQESKQAKPAHNKLTHHQLKLAARTTCFTAATLSATRPSCQQAAAGWCRSSLATWVWVPSLDTCHTTASSSRSPHEAPGTACRKGRGPLFPLYSWPAVAMAAVVNLGGEGVAGAGGGAPAKGLAGRLGGGALRLGGMAGAHSDDHIGPLVITAVIITAADVIGGGGLDSGSGGLDGGGGGHQHTQQQNSSVRALSNSTGCRLH